MVGMKHTIISNTEAITKEGLEKDKEIRSLKKENIALKRKIKDIESVKMPIERLKKFEPLMEGMDEVKQEVINNVLMMVTQFMDALEQVSIEKQKLKDIVTTKINLVRVLESQRPVIEEFQMTWDISYEDAIFGNDYWFYLNNIQQIAIQFQEVKKDVTSLNDKVNTSLELMSFEVKFLEDTIPKKTDLVLTKAKNLLQSLIQIEDVNTFKAGNHLKHMLRAHAWKLELQRVVVKVNCHCKEQGKDGKNASWIRADNQVPR